MQKHARNANFECLSAARQAVKCVTFFSFSFAPVESWTDWVWVSHRLLMADLLITLSPDNKELKLHHKKTPSISVPNDAVTAPWCVCVFVRGTICPLPPLCCAVLCSAVLVSCCVLLCPARRPATHSELFPLSIRRTQSVPRAFHCVWVVPGHKARPLSLYPPRQHQAGVLVEGQR